MSKQHASDRLEDQVVRPSEFWLKKQETYSKTKSHQRHGSKWPLGTNRVWQRNWQFHKFWFDFHRYFWEQTDGLKLLVTPNGPGTKRSNFSPRKKVRTFDKATTGIK